ncbi:hypothetical protein K438DRAFT_1772367 [Mycena galopus ATCC 62051]|nr:hypothetical protein K438DRAFT_1772367 [Mycena galopus ATCC 62051]
MPLLGVTRMALSQTPAIHIIRTELVREIVRACCDGSVEIILPFPDLKPPAVSVSQFCSRWRTVAHSEPALWQKFRVDLSDELHGGRYEALMNFIGNDAARNKTCLVLHQGEYRPLDLNPLLPILVSYARSLQSLSLNIPGQTFEQLFPAAALPLSHLEALSVALRVRDEKDISFLEIPEDVSAKIFTNLSTISNLVAVLQIGEAVQDLNYYMWGRSNKSQRHKGVIRKVAFQSKTGQK